MRNLRKKVAACALVAASFGLGGTAEAADNAKVTPGWPTMEFLCELGGGVYYQGKYVSYCFYRDGTIVACYDDGRCVTYKPDPKALNAGPTSAAATKVAR